MICTLTCSVKQVNVLFFEFLLEYLVVDLIFAGEEFGLPCEVVWTKRHLHEEFLGNFSHTFEVWMHIVFRDSIIFSIWITEHLPSVDHMSSWDISQRSNF